MAVERVNDLRAFQGFIEEKLTQGGTNLTLDDALISWELENQTDEERAETLDAIQLGLDDLYAGRTVDALSLSSGCGVSFRTKPTHELSRQADSERRSRF